MLLRASWFGVIPALLSGVVVRRLLPPPAAASGTDLASELVRLANGHVSVVWLALLLSLGAVVRHFAAHLPGADHFVAQTERAHADEAPPPSTAGEAAGSNRGAARAGWMRSLTTLAVLAFVALAIRMMVFDTLRVQSSSMLPALQVGDTFGVLRSAYGLGLPGGARRLGARLPGRGDVIVFAADRPAEGQPAHLVKRVIGLPGDRVGMQGGHPVINGSMVPNCDAGTYTYVAPGYAMAGRLTVEFLGDRAYLTIHTPLARPFANTYVVQPGEVFVLGDNRNNSSDSRAWNGGMGRGVPEAAIEGRADRVLVATRRDGSADFAQLFRPLGMSLNLPGVDVRRLEAGIARCLKDPPAQTLPPG